MIQSLSSAPECYLRSKKFSHQGRLGADRGAVGGHESGKGSWGRLTLVERQQGRPDGSSSTFLAAPVDDCHERVDEAQRHLAQVDGGEERLYKLAPEVVAHTTGHLDPLGPTASRPPVLAWLGHLDPQTTCCFEGQLSKRDGQRGGRVEHARTGGGRSGESGGVGTVGTGHVYVGGHWQPFAFSHAACTSTARVPS